MGKIVEDKDTIKNLMHDIMRGIYNIPRFQREFVWPPKKIVSLIKSIEANFPFGAILVAESQESSLDGRNPIIDIISNSNYNKNGKVVVDGQQRITSIAIVYYAAELGRYIDSERLPKDQASKLKSAYNTIAFFEDEFYELNNLSEYLEEKEGISSSAAKSKSKNYLISIPDINKKVQEKLNRREVFIHTLSGWSDSEIIKIFTALNKDVKALTHVDLMNGSMFNVSNGAFDLIKFIKNSNKKWEYWGKIKNELFAQLLKIYSDLYLMSHDSGNSTDYRSNKLVKWAGDKDYIGELIENKIDFIRKITQTMSILERKYKILSMKYLPKEVFFISIFALLCKLDQKDSNFEKQLNLIFAHTSKRLVLGDYASSPNAKAQDDINTFLIPSILGNEMNNRDYGDWKKSLQMRLDTLKYKNKTDGIFKLANSIIAMNQPRMFFKDEFINVTPSSVTEMNFDIHHFIPMNSEFAKTYRFGEDLLNSIGNLTLLSKEENRNQVKARNPQDYLIDSKKELGPELFKKTIESHLFDINIINELINLKKDAESVQVYELLEKLFNDRTETIFEKLKEKFL